MIRALCLIFSLFALPVHAAQGFNFDSIDGGTLDLADWRGQPVLVVNTASRCAFTPQYDALQALYDRYRDRGLVVLAVPSDDFRQELDDAAAVKEFCEVNFGLTLPMTGITHVTGPEAHALYRWLRDSHGFTPAWNFNKALIGPDGALVATYGATARPLSRRITGDIEALLD
ncbi:glutathione peroxidase [Aestuariicoccus sp. MJ-SS9]|uniref:glutathione peroxidase n=1 Tax=Aestuariicoccus sp. MJ-SS9 TaxID=3079855 RepID=UPI0029063437|nr:glutathione peroxidase [Aestuariicoccus sp. MJ-SS9]MDU8914127.1 glutathione peroxidase [Aestuariicoccus sp. MJ-SS9]